MFQKAQGAVKMSIVPPFIYPAKYGNQEKDLSSFKFSLAAPQSHFHIEFLWYLSPEKGMLSHLFLKCKGWLKPGPPAF